MAGAVPTDGDQHRPGLLVRPLLVVSVHDVAPTSMAAAARWAHLLAPLNVPLTFLVIPGPWRGPAFDDDPVRGPGAAVASWLRERQEHGDEVCLHGWSHRADVLGPAHRRLVGALVARGAAEFWALDRGESRARTRRGLDLLGRHGLDVVGVTPPGWLASRAAVRGFADVGLRYATDHAGLIDLSSGRRWPAPVVCHRPAAPASGPSRFGAGGRPLSEELGRRAVAASWRTVVLGRSVRIGLHPDDLARPGLDAAARRAVERALDAGAEPVTYREVADRLTALSPRSTD